MKNLDFPENVMIQTHSYCNSACVFCPHADVSGELPQGRMDWSTFEKIVEELKKHPGIKRIMPYLMNEPLLDPEIVEKINYIKEKIPEASVHILTNGSLLTPELSKRLIDSGLDWIGFSVHGIREATYKKTMVGLELKETLKNISSFLKLARSKRPSDFVMITFLGGDHLSPGEKEEVFNYWQQKGVERISYFGKPVSRAGNVRCIPSVRKARVSGCRSIWRDEMLHILFNGDVVPCCMDWRREVVLGNVKESSLSDIWHSSAYNEFKEKLHGLRESHENFLCKRCEEALPECEGIQASEEAEQLERITRKIAGLRGELDSLKRGLEPPTSVADILLVTTPPWGVDNPPVGLAHLTTYLKVLGFDVEVLDFNIDLFHRAGQDLQGLWHVENKNFWSNEHTFQYLRALFDDEIDRCVEEMLKVDSSVVGFSVVDPKERMTIEFIKRLKKRQPRRLVILGGPACYLEETRRIFLKEIPRLVDGFVLGEGEETLECVLEAVNSGRRRLNGIPGVMVYDGQDHVEYLSRPRVANLDSLPFPTFEEFNGKYLSRSLILEWSRGCIGNCVFCKGRLLDGPYRGRSAKEIFEALERYVESQGIKDFTICDPVINGDLEMLDGLCELLIGAGWGISWRGQALPVPGMTGKLLEKMKAAGCCELQWGVETGSDLVLKKMGKLRLFTSSDAERVIRQSHEVGIKTVLFIIVGFPGETDEEFEKTVDFIARNARYIDQLKSINSLHLITGTPIYTNAKKYGVVLPKPDEHYKWYTDDGNTTDLRNARIKRLLELAATLGIEVLETNIEEGKETRFQQICASRLKDSNFTNKSSLFVKFDPLLEEFKREIKVKSVEYGVGRRE